jgi:hemerythrin-like domain-containing protein
MPTSPPSPSAASAGSSAARGEGVKRHPALVALSEDHHHELVQARRLLTASAEPPDERARVARAYVELFFTETVEHFRREEERVFPLYARQPAANTELLERILREHMELHGLARALRAEAAAGDVSAETLEALGSLLHAHVRLEERELFEDVQRVVPPEELDRLDR